MNMLESIHHHLALLSQSAISARDSPFPYVPYAATLALLIDFPEDTDIDSAYSVMHRAINVH